MKDITILIPTCNRPEALAVTLTSLCFQTCKDFDLVISDQSEDERTRRDQSLSTALHLLKMHSHKATVLRNLPPKGMAQQRQFLLEHSATKYSLFLDDDLILEPYVIANMRQTIEQEHCGFAGNAAIGLSYQNDVRPGEQEIELWDEKVVPETILPGQKEWERYRLHNAANIYHVQQKLQASAAVPLRYKVAWIGGCVMYETEKLRDTGGFSFWDQLPQNHCGEEALAQLRVMKKYGGCGILPSGVFHQELPTTVPDRKINAPEYLPI